MNDAALLSRIAVDINCGGRGRRAALRQRLAGLAAALGGDVAPQAPTRELVAQVAAALRVPTAPTVWLAIATLTGSLPDNATVTSVLRRMRLDGPLTVLAELPPRTPPGWPRSRVGWPEVEIVTGEVLVDLHHTADTTLATGIQRVSREVSRRWSRDHAVRLLQWLPDFSAVVELDAPGRSRALFGTPATEAGHTEPPRRLVPWRSTYLLPELMTEIRRAEALQALAAYSGSVTGMLGMDCVPITTAETVGEGMGGGFSVMLTAAARMTRIATISTASATEYSGWRTMLAGAGLTGPDVRAIPLAVEVPEVGPAVVAAARHELCLPGLPMVLVVGSHEPRKNHVAILHAAELLWREGRQFSLVFIGGNAWHSGPFTRRLQQLRDVGRPVESRSGASDELLWGAYRVAHTVLFPSLNEGFGLPVAEALASGTPVITSGFGSMAEVAALGGALFVDPRDDHDIAGALRRLLVDPALHAELAGQAAVRRRRSWDAYAAETWDYLVEGTHPASSEAQQLVRA